MIKIRRVRGAHDGEAIKKLIAIFTDDIELMSSEGKPMEIVYGMYSDGRGVLVAREAPLCQ